jgi:hypothetical protein
MIGSSSSSYPNITFLAAFFFDTIAPPLTYPSNFSNLLKTLLHQPIDMQQRLFL